MNEHFTEHEWLINMKMINLIISQRLQIKTTVMPFYNTVVKFKFTLFVGQDVGPQEFSGSHNLIRSKT